MPVSERRSLTEWGPLALILLLAAGLRLTRLGLIEFKYDEATTARSALAIVRECQLPAVGMITSQGPRNPALMSYVLAPPFALTRDPRLAAGWIALLGVAAVGLTYWLGQAYFDRWVGALAAILFAASPWAVFQSRKIWTQNLPVLTLLFVVAVLALVVRRKPWALVGALGAAAGLASLHLGGLAFFFVLAAVLVLFFRRVRPLPLLVGLVVLALILSPYLIHDARHDWRNLRAFKNLGQSEAMLNPQAPRMAAAVVGGYQLEALAGERHASFIASILDLRWLDQAEIALFWIGLTWLIWRVGREAVAQRGCLSRDGEARLVLLCWFVVPVALLMRRTPVHPHDFNLLYPVQHLVTALLLADVIGWGEDALQRPEPRISGLGPRVLRSIPYVCLLFVALLVVWHVYLWETMMSFVDTHETPGGYGAPLKYALAATRRAEASLENTESAELIALLPGGDPRYDGQATVFDVLLGAEDRRLVDGRQALVLPEHQAVYLVHPEASGATSPLLEMATEVGTPRPLRGGSDAVYRFFQRQPTRVKPTHPRDDEPRHWILRSDSGQASSATLLGHDWSGEARPGGAIRWTLIWRVNAQPPAGIDLHWFNHLVDEEGARRGQKDGVGLPTSKWHADDIVLAWFEIPIAPDAPPPPYFVRSGMYTYPDVINVPVVDAAGNPAGAFVELGPIDAAP